MGTKELDFNVWTVLTNIEWHDPLLIGIILFHIAVTLMALLTRNHGNFQVLLFLTLLLLVYFSENINELASHHWMLLSNQQYFDSKGMFISLIFSVPILLNCMVMMASWLWQSSELMVQLKSAQLKQKRELAQNGCSSAESKKSK
ncbi:transmembrane protein 18 [Cimex lectularius]|uniref:Transmembrane protein 18 n=1 Tax=Cimex lectularius TaxID=79782 RepID=A0A8I6S0P8_CIMLE|nr:transmembrane protein 18 [Cimex lectularius]